MALIANNVITGNKPARVSNELPAGKSFNEVRENRVRKLEAKKKRTVSSYQHDMTTVHKV